LLDVLARVSEKLSLSIVVAHVDHALSEQSAAVAARVSHSAATAGFEVHVARAPDLEGPNLHARARDFRYEFLEIVATKESANRIATGHTLDDRIETTLARFVHGAGTDGLAGLPPSDGIRARPLIDLRRGETRAYCDECGLGYIDDPANFDPRFERSVMREEILKTIEDRFGDGAVRAMATSVERLAEDSAALNALADRLYRDLAEGEGGLVTFPLATFDPLPRGLRRRVLERAVGRVRDRNAGIDEVLDALERGGPKGRAEGAFDLAGGVRIRITRDRLEVDATGA
jgi:tRNA(Ile)-lysidine synthase